MDQARRKGVTYYKRVTYVSRGRLLQIKKWEGDTYFSQKVESSCRPKCGRSFHFVATTFSRMDLGCAVSGVSYADVLNGSRELPAVSRKRPTIASQDSRTTKQKETPQSSFGRHATHVVLLQKRLQLKSRSDTKHPVQLFSRENTRSVTLNGEYLGGVLRKVAPLFF